MPRLRSHMQKVPLPARLGFVITLETPYRIPPAYIYMYVYFFMYIHESLHTYTIIMYIYTCLCTCIHPKIYTFIHTCINTCIYFHGIQINTCRGEQLHTVRTHICTQKTCMDAHRTYVRMYQRNIRQDFALMVKE